MIDDPIAWDKTKAKLVAKSRRAPEATRACIEAIENSVNLDASEALIWARRHFTKLMAGSQSKALRHIFFAERATPKLERIKGVDARALEKIGVVGGGTMGAGIAATFLLAGLSVVLIERDEKSLAAGLGRVAAILDASVRRGSISEAKHTSFLAALCGAQNTERLGDCDMVVEAVFEEMETKLQVFAQLDDVTRPDAILATNTSYLDVAKIAGSVADPSRVIGVHFFAPAHVMKLLEVIHHPALADEVLAGVVSLGKRLGKIPVPAGVCDGFIGNRIMSAYRRACDEMLEDGALPHHIDEAMRDFGFPMGVYEMQDLAGLDISWAMRKRQAAESPSIRRSDQRYVAIADRVCEAGRFGRKTGAGWYDSPPRVGPPGIRNGWRRRSYRHRKRRGSSAAGLRQKTSWQKFCTSCSRRDG